jgi:uncharacterized protein (TIGR03435 family)
MGLVSALLLMGAAAVAQAPRAFAVISIKPFHRTSSTGYRPDQTGPGGLHWTGDNLRYLICHAYGIEEYQLKADKKWVDGEMFSLDATTTAPATKQQLMLMLRGVLADRFGLRLEHHPQPTKVNALVMTEGGLKLPPAGADEHPTANELPGRIYELKVQTMATFAKFLTSFYGFGQIGPVVVDQTGLTGRYDIDFRIPILEGRGPAHGAEHLDYFEFPAALKRMGLELKPATVPMEMYTIVSAHEPTQN